MRSAIYTFMMEVISKFNNKLRGLRTRVLSKRGQTLVEYALILALIVLIVIVALGLLGNQLLNFFNLVTSSLGSVSGS